MLYDSKPKTITLLNRLGTQETEHYFKSRYKLSSTFKSDIH